MIRYVLKRLLLLIPVIIAVSFIIYALMDLAPGTIVDQMISDKTTPEELEMLYKKYDLDKPLDYIPTYDEALDYLERNGYASEIYQGEEFDMSGLLEEYNRRGVFLAGYNH